MEPTIIAIIAYQLIFHILYVHNFLVQFNTNLVESAVYENSFLYFDE